MHRMAIRIGTSGFIYEHWRRRFYPPSAGGSELESYALLVERASELGAYLRTFCTDGATAARVCRSCRMPS